MFFNGIELRHPRCVMQWQPVNARQTGSDNIAL